MAFQLGRLIAAQSEPMVQLDGPFQHLGHCSNPAAGARNYYAYTNISKADAEDWGNYCDSCLGGQASPGGGTKGSLVLNASPIALVGRVCLVLSHRYTVASGSIRYRMLDAYWKATGSADGSLRLRNRLRLRPRAPEWPAPAVDPEVGPRPLPRLRPHPLARDKPGVTVTISDRGVTHSRPGVSSPPRRPRPPGRDVHERKFVIAMTGGVLARVIGAAGELGDFVEAFYSTLPRKLKSKDADTLQARIAILVKNWEAVDWEKGLGNLLVNEVEDRAIGRFGREIARVNREIGRPAGLTIGPVL